VPVIVPPILAILPSVTPMSAASLRPGVTGRAAYHKIKAVHRSIVARGTGFLTWPHP
jgi:hypothetical protein